MRDLDKAPGNARIAAALLDVLTGVGDGPGRARAERALEDGTPPRRRRTDWIDPARLRDAFRAASVGPQEARRVGRVLVAPQAVGLLLSYAGIATPEKAYRRCDRILPREEPGDRFEAVHVEEGGARVEFHPACPSPQDVLFCQVRAGMLEALTPLYGLLPARVDETACAHRGAPACVYQLRWRRTPRSGLLLGSAVGGLLGCAAGAGLALLAGLADSLAIGVALLVSLSGIAAGRAIDLARQLDAVAQGGLGHLALLDQADGVLAEKMDLLAKLERAGAEPAVERSLGSAPLRAREPEPRPESLARRLHPPIATLRRAVDELREATGATAAAGPKGKGRAKGPGQGQGKGKAKGKAKGKGKPSKQRIAALLDECEAAARALHAMGVEVAEEEGGTSSGFQSADLAQLVRRGVAAVKSERAAAQEIELEIGCEPAPIRGEPFQLEQVVQQLVTNAADAMHGEGKIQVELRPCPEGFEFAVSDTGEGIDPEILDNLFDPFFEKPAGTDGGLGLTICYRIVKRHGGELAVHSEEGRGTRIAVVLPAEA